MSGGHFNYRDSELKNEIFDYEDKPKTKFEDIEISNLVWDVLELIHDYDWYMSGDTVRSDYLESKQRFKNKWFGGNRDSRLQGYIDERLVELSEELKQMLVLGKPEDEI